MPPLESSLSLNDRAVLLADTLCNQAAALNVKAHYAEDGVRIIDAGVDCRGSFAAGVLVARICMSDLGSVQIRSSNRFEQWRFEVDVTASNATLACLASQYAGWALAGPRDDDSSKTYRAMASGPGRALSVKEPLFKELNFKDKSEHAVLVLESDRLPPSSVREKVIHDCAVDASKVTLIVTPTGSMAGVVQIAARVVEVALHKAHALHFPIESVLDGVGTTPLPAPTADGLIAMGRTNDTILFGGSVHLFVDANDDACEQLANQMPSSTSRDYGKPFARVFSDYDFDFFKIDPLLFSPAQIWITNVTSGRTFSSGRIDEAMLMQSFS